MTVFDMLMKLENMMWVHTVLKQRLKTGKKSAVANAHNIKPQDGLARADTMWTLEIFGQMITNNQ